jgi:hypothetical protein
MTDYGPNPIIQKLAESIGLKMLNPESEAKVQALAESYAEKASDEAVKSTLNPDAVERAVQARKQSIFGRPRGIAQ